MHLQYFPGVSFTSVAPPRRPPTAPSSRGFVFRQGPQTVTETRSRSWRFKGLTPQKNAGYEFGSGLLTTAVLPGAVVLQSPLTPSANGLQFPFKSYRDGFCFAQTGELPRLKNSDTEWNPSTLSSLEWSYDYPWTPPYSPRGVERRLREAKQAEIRTREEAKVQARRVFQLERQPVHTPLVYY